MPAKQCVRQLVALSTYLQERIIEIGKRIVAERHVYVTNLVESHGEHYISTEVDDELGIGFQIRMYPHGFSPFTVLPGTIVYEGEKRLSGHIDWADGL